MAMISYWIRDTNMLHAEERDMFGYQRKYQCNAVEGSVHLFTNPHGRTDRLTENAVYRGTA
jgi:hypothetical protein